MIPDTLNYMVAGYTVVILGIAGYLVSLAVRSSKAARLLEKSEKKEGADPS